MNPFRKVFYCDSSLFDSFVQEAYGKNFFNFGSIVEPESNDSYWQYELKKKEDLSVLDAQRLELFLESKDNQDLCKSLEDHQTSVIRQSILASKNKSLPPGDYFCKDIITIILKDLVNRDILPVGEYVITYSW